jgi:hypothetical protein
MVLISSPTEHVADASAIGCTGRQRLLVLLARMIGATSGDAWISPLS